MRTPSNGCIIIIAVSVVPPSLIFCGWSPLIAFCAMRAASAAHEPSSCSIRTVIIIIHKSIVIRYARMCSSALGAIVVAFEARGPASTHARRR